MQDKPYYYIHSYKSIVYVVNWLSYSPLCMLPIHWSSKNKAERSILINRLLVTDDLCII